MASQTVMRIIAVCGVTPVILAQDIFSCHNLQYAGPIKEVIEMRPTKLAEKTSDAAKISIGFCKDHDLKCHRRNPSSRVHPEYAF